MAESEIKLVQNMEILTDQELVSRVKQGDKKAFSLLVKRHQKGILRLSLRFVKDVDVAEDVVQESFIKAYERINSYEERAQFKSWLYQITINTAKNKIRSRRNGMTDIDEVPLAVSARAEVDLLHSAVSKMINKYIEDLPFKQRTALTLRIYEDLSFKEIAEIMECPYDTAKANYRHAILRLKEDLHGHQELSTWTEDVGTYFLDETPRTAEAES